MYSLYYFIVVYLILHLQSCFVLHYEMSFIIGPWDVCIKTTMLSNFKAFEVIVMKLFDYCYYLLDFWVYGLLFCLIGFSMIAQICQVAGACAMKAAFKAFGYCYIRISLVAIAPVLNVVCLFTNGVNCSLLVDFRLRPVLGLYLRVLPAQKVLLLVQLLGFLVQDLLLDRP